MAKTISDAFFNDVAPQVPSTKVTEDNLTSDEFTRLVDRVVNPHPSNYSTSLIDGYTADRANLFSRLHTPGSCHKAPAK